MTRTHIHAIFCLWSFNGEGEAVLEDSYGVDDDGRAVTKMKYPTDERESWAEFTGKRIAGGDNSEGYEWEYIPGRAVTVWRFESGVNLVYLHPQSWPSWLDHFATDVIRKNGNWHRILKSGGTMLFGTADAARELLEKNHATRSPRLRRM